MTTFLPNKQPQRRGLGISEMIVSLVILGTAAGFLVPMFYRLGEYRSVNLIRAECRDQVMNLAGLLQQTGQRQTLNDEDITQIVKETIDPDRWEVTCQKRSETQELLGVIFDAWNIKAVSVAYPESVQVQMTVWLPRDETEAP